MHVPQPMASGPYTFKTLSKVFLYTDLPTSPNVITCNVIDVKPIIWNSITLYRSYDRYTPTRFFSFKRWHCKIVLSSGSKSQILDHKMDQEWSQHFENRIKNLTQVGEGGFGGGELEEGDGGTKGKVVSLYLDLCCLSSQLCLHHRPCKSCKCIWCGTYDHSLLELNCNHIITNKWVYSKHSHYIQAINQTNKQAGRQ